MDYIFHIGVVTIYWAIAAISLNLILGNTGLLSVTHAAFIGIGAYATAIMTTVYQENYLLSILTGVIIAAAISFLIGLVLSRFKGDYYMLVTIGLNVVIFSVLLNWGQLTGGPIGIPKIPRPDLFGFSIKPGFGYFIFMLVALALIIFLARIIANSSFGRVLGAIREDERALSIFGYKTQHFKLAIFVMGAMMAALAGSLMAPYFSFIDPNGYSIHESVAVLIIVVFGGLGSIRGSILGAVILTLIPELLRFVGFPSTVIGEARLIIYGLALVLLMMYRPQGLLGKFKL